MAPLIIGNPAGGSEEAALQEAIIEKAGAEFQERLRQALTGRSLPPRSPQETLELETALHDAGREAADCTMAVIVEAALRDPSLQTEALARTYRRPEEFREVGIRPTSVRLLGGRTLSIATAYVVKNRRGKPGRKRKPGGRGRAGTGRYPILDALGFVAGATPALAARVARQSAQSSSFADARGDLASFGVRMDVKTVRRISYAFASKALAMRQARRQWANLGALPKNGEFAGKRVVVGLDGGRLRTREARRRGRRRKKSGRRGFGTPWREPKVCAVYEVNAEGKKTGKSPVYEATLENWETAFDMFAAALLRYGVGEAAELIFVNDGSHTIRDGLDKLIQRLGIDLARVTKVVDFYHAVEKVFEAAGLCAAWSARRRTRWANRVEKDLREGRFPAVIEAMDALCHGRRGKAMRKIVDYFTGNEERMRYRAFRRRKIPIGSGMVESTIRRVVNLRLKGPGIFWKVQNAERMLVLRAALKSGRWDEFVRDTIADLEFRVEVRIGDHAAATPAAKKVPA